MSSMWNLAELKKNVIVSAKNIVTEQCKELERITGGKVESVLDIYDGRYKSENYSVSDGHLSSPSSCISQLKKKAIETFDVQDVLGDQGDDEEFVYEFYLTSKATSYYKFSIFLLYFDTKLYPVGLSIEQSIADEIGCETEIKIPDEEAFRNILASILASNTVTNVIKNLLAF